MRDDKIHKVCMDAIEKFGVKHQVSKAIEELAELIAELSKVKEDELHWEAYEEMADAYIMLYQLIFSKGDKSVHAFEKALWQKSFRLLCILEWKQ